MDASTYISLVTVSLGIPMSVAIASVAWLFYRRGFRAGRRFERGYRPLGRGYLRTIGADASIKTPGGGRAW